MVAELRGRGDEERLRLGPVGLPAHRGGAERAELPAVVGHDGLDAAEVRLVIRLLHGGVLVAPHLPYCEDRPNVGELLCDSAFSIAF